MKKYFLVASIALFDLSCSQPRVGNENRVLRKDAAVKATAKSATANRNRTVEPDTGSAGYPAWADTLVSSYMKQTNNELVRYAITHHLKEEWVLDDQKKTDTATYWVFNIGHDVSEPDGSETRYISDSWVYVDSARKKLYEQDLTSDRLIEWKK